MDDTNEQTIPGKTNNKAPEINFATSLAIYKRLLGYTRPYLAYFIISLFGYVLFSAMEVAMADLVKYFIKGIETRDSIYLWAVPLAIIIARILHGIGSYLGNYYIARIGFNAVNDVRKQLFAHLMYLPCNFFDKNNSGELVSLLIYNIQQIVASVTHAVRIIFRDGFMVIAMITYLFWLNWKLTLIFLISAPILAGLVSIASRYFRKVSRRMQVTMGDITHISNETLQGFRLVKSYNGQEYEIKRFNHSSDQNTLQSNKFERVSALQGPIYHVVIAINLAVILFLILLFWEDEVGAAVAYLTAAAMIAKPIRQLSSVNTYIQRGLAAAESIFAVLDTPQEQDKNQTELDAKQGKIEFKNVSFKYDDEHPALSDINLVIAPGETVALVGKSGSGKSTLTSLLLRFYEADNGDILIDDQNIQEVSLKSLRKQIAFVNQQTVLFNDTVLNNIAYGSDSNSVDQEKIKTVTQQAHINEFIDSVPEGIESMAGENGNRFSGGQRQRITVARALYKDAPILILDEATSALDSESEKLIQSAIEEVQKNCTTLVIAHRLSTIENADKIVVMDQGKIIEIGTHSELLNKNGAYAALHTLQFSS